MTKQIILSGVAAGALLVSATGCVSSRSGQTFSRGEALSAQTVQEGQIIELQEGKIEGTDGIVGGIAGGALGAVTGRAIGAGTGRDIATVAGGLIGAAAGALAEEQLTKSSAYMITVKLDDGQVKNIVQEKDVGLAVGQRVRVLSSREGRDRVVPMR